MSDQAWSAEAVCIGAGEIFFDPERVAEAEALCAGCPVLRACEAYADTNGITEGVWGGRDRTAPPAPEPPAPKPHRVSYGSYVAHLRAGEDPCTGCRQAKKDYQRDYDRRRAAAKRKTG